MAQQQAQTEDHPKVVIEGVTPQATAVDMRIVTTISRFPQEIPLGEPVLVDISMINEGDTGTGVVEVRADGEFKASGGGFIAANGGFRHIGMFTFNNPVSQLEIRVGTVDFDEQDRLRVGTTQDQHTVNVTTTGAIAGLPRQTLALTGAGFAAGVLGTALVTGELGNVSL